MDVGLLLDGRNRLKGRLCATASLLEAKAGGGGADGLDGTGGAGTGYTSCFAAVLREDASRYATTVSLRKSLGPWLPEEAGYLPLPLAVIAALLFLFPAPRTEATVGAATREAARRARHSDPDEAKPERAGQAQRAAMMARLEAALRRLEASDNPEDQARVAALAAALRRDLAREQASTNDSSESEVGGDSSLGRFGERVGDLASLEVLLDRAASLGALPPEGASIEEGGHSVPAAARRVGVYDTEIPLAYRDDVLAYLKALESTTDSGSMSP